MVLRIVQKINSIIQSALRTWSSPGQTSANSVEITKTWDLPVCYRSTLDSRSRSCMTHSSRLKTKADVKSIRGNHVRQISSSAIITPLCTLCVIDTRQVWIRVVQRSFVFRVVSPSGGNEILA